METRKVPFTMSYFLPPLSSYTDKEGKTVGGSFQPCCSISLQQLYQFVTSSQKLAGITRQVREGGPCCKLARRLRSEPPRALRCQPLLGCAEQHHLQSQLRQRVRTGPLQPASGERTAAHQPPHAKHRPSLSALPRR